MPVPPRLPPTPQQEARFPDLVGEVAIVTGVAGNIGTGIARCLARQGMRVVLVDHPGKEREGRAFADELTAAGHAVLWVAGDLTTATGAAAVFAATLGRFAAVHVLVNNAAMLGSKSFLDVDEADWSQSCEGNLRIIYHLSLISARWMAANGGGRIVHISSVGGARAHYGMAGYDAYKGGLDALTRAMACDLGAHGIRVNAVAPGVMAGRDRSTPQPVGFTPIARATTGGEIGLAVAFLASASAACITGQVLTIDGGMTAQLHPPYGTTIH